MINNQSRYSVVLFPVCLAVLVACNSGSSESQVDGVETSNGGTTISDNGPSDVGTDSEGTNNGSVDSGDNTNFGNGNIDLADGGSTGDENTNENAVDANATQPNILLVITDDQGLDASAQYSLSTDLPNTPVIDELARNGIVYENAWATPSCTTTRATLLTGKHGVNNGVTRTPGTLSADIGTIQAHLNSNVATRNYQTAVFGKWHVAGNRPDPDHPAQLGVQHYAGNLTGNLTDYFNWTATVNGVEQRNTNYHTSVLVDNAIDWIEEQSSPWFTWVAFSAPHSPFHAPPAQFNTRNLSGTDADIASNTRGYFLSAIETIDTELGRLLDSMDNVTRDNTIIIVIGDNGTPRTVIDRSTYISASHGKGSLFEGGVRVPLVISGAGVSRNNAREEGLVSIADFFPTIASLAGANNVGAIDGQSIVPSFTQQNAITREFNYTEFLSDEALGSGWTVRSLTHKYIAYDDGTEALYDLVTDSEESTNLLLTGVNFAATVGPLKDFGDQVRGQQEPSAVIDSPLNITDRIIDNRSPNCADHANQYLASATDASTGVSYDANLTVAVNDTQCVFTSNAIPNHTFNDGVSAFPNQVSVQNEDYRVALVPQLAPRITELSLQYDDAVLLNGVKVDLLAAGCFGVGDGRIGCNDNNQPWRYDPMFLQNGFRVDQHNAHTQPNGAYHYHGSPNALFDRSGTVVSAVIGFAADGFPVYGSYINDNDNIRAVTSSYQLKTGNRPAGPGQPGAVYDGTFRDDYEFVANSGDLDECNGMTNNGAYGYYVTDAFPYLMACYKGTVDESFRK